MRGGIAIQKKVRPTFCVTKRLGSCCSRTITGIRPHREDGPALFLRRTDSPTKHVMVDEEYRRHGRLHRNSAEGPAEIHRDETTGIVLHESYYEKDELHRDPAQGPATISRDRVTGRVIGETYWVRGVRHRDPADGPAIVAWNPETRAITQAEYFVDGNPVPAPTRPARRPRRTGPENGPTS